MKKDLYSILNVDKSASANDIKKSYRKLALEHHPDRGGVAEIFKEITAAYAVLIDENKRKDYDMFGISDENNISKDDISNIFQQMFQRSFNDISNMNNKSPYSDFINIDDIIGDISNLNCEVKIFHNMASMGPISDLFTINKDNFKVNVSEKKNESEPKNETEKINCYVSIDEIIEGNPNKKIKKKCQKCIKECECSEENIIEIEISPGIKNNQILILKEKGSYNEKTNTYNDIEIHIKYLLPKNIKIKDKHLIVYLELTLDEVFGGFSKKIQVGKNYLNVVIENYIDPNNPIIYENCGIPISENEKGDIIIIPKIKYPNEKKVLKYKDLLLKIINNLYQ
jgi:DnaJ-class molecular chaperone